MIYFNIRNLCALIHTASAFSLQISENFIFDHRKQILVILKSTTLPMCLQNFYI